MALSLLENDSSALRHRPQPADYQLHLGLPAGFPRSPLIIDDLFGDFNGGPADFAQKVEFYQREQIWTNSMIQGRLLRLSFPNMRTAHFPASERFPE